MSIIEWRPTPIQELALATTASEVLFGGSRGGGKIKQTQHYSGYYTTQISLHLEA